MQEVVAALIEKENKFLICQRPKGKNLEMKWEFAGGKIEKGETPEQALIRECQEELAITLNVYEKIAESTHKYKDSEIHIVLFRTTIKEGTPTMLEHNDMQWITLDEAENFDFCPSDKEFVEELKKIR